MHNGEGFFSHWGFGFGHWSLGILFWLLLILAVVALFKYVSNGRK